MSDIDSYKPSVKYCVIINNEFISHNGSFKFSYEKAELLLEDRKAQIKKAIEKEQKIKEKIRLQLILSQAKIEIYKEH